MTEKKTDNSKVAVLGHWEIGYMTPIMEANFWNLVIRDFEISEWYMTPVSGIRHNEDQKINLYERDTYDEVFEETKDLKRVFLEPRTLKQPDTTWLHEFKHPKKCLYVFGSAHYNPTIAHKRDKDVVVSIKTIQDTGVLWSNQCLAIVLYDRLMKGI